MTGLQPLIVVVLGIAFFPLGLALAALVVMIASYGIYLGFVWPWWYLLSLIGLAPDPPCMPAHEESWGKR